MIHIGHFLLLLFCTLTNMIHSMHSEELTRLQKNYSYVELSSQQLLATIFPPNPAAQVSIKTEPDDECSNTLSNALSNHLSSSSSSSTWQLLAQTTTRKRKLAQEQSKNGQRQKIDIAEQQSILPSLALMINTQSLSKTELLIPSNIKDNTVQPSLRQPPRKKRKVNQKDIPDNAYFTITCKHCFPEKQFQTSLKNNLIKNFKKHSKNKHSSMTDNETEIYIGEHLQKPELLLKFSVHCPKPECKHIAHNVTKFDLKRNLSNHIFNKHPENKDDYSIESVATYVEENCTKALVPVKRKLDIPDNAYFTIVCTYCSHKLQFQTFRRDDLISSFKRHLKKKHPSIDDKQTQIYIKNHLQEPEQRLNFLVHCPEPECKWTVYCLEKNKLKISLSRHMSRKHPENKGNYSIKSVATYVANNCKQTLVSAQEQLRNTKKRKINN